MGIYYNILHYSYVCLEYFTHISFLHLPQVLMGANVDKATVQFCESIVYYRPLPDIY